MPIYFLGTGLGSHESMSLETQNILRSCDKIYLDCYTGFLLKTEELSEIEKSLNISIVGLTREEVEADDQTNPLLNSPLQTSAAFLVVGDPFFATTHSDLRLRLMNKGVEVITKPATSIWSYIAHCGVSAYKMGYTVSICRDISSAYIASFTARIMSNLNFGCHTLCLLDIKTREIDYFKSTSKVNVYEPTYYMSASEASTILLNQIELGAPINKKTKCIVMARIGQKNERVYGFELEQGPSLNFGDAPHALILLAEGLDELESAFFSHWSNDHK